MDEFVFKFLAWAVLSVLTIGAATVFELFAITALTILAVVAIWAVIIWGGFLILDDSIF